MGSQHASSALAVIMVAAGTGLSASPAQGSPALGHAGAQPHTPMVPLGPGGPTSAAAPITTGQRGGPEPAAGFHSPRPGVPQVRLPAASFVPPTSPPKIAGLSSRGEALPLGLLRLSHAFERPVTVPVCPRVHL